MEQLTSLYKQFTGHSPAKIEKIDGAGSNRQYYRFISDSGDSIVGVIGTSRDENHAFIYLDRHFLLRKLPVPEILAVSNDELRYLQTDLGTQSLFDAIRGGREAGGRYNQDEQALLQHVICELPNIQIRGARGLDWNNCYPQPAFDVESVLFDLNYFKYCFLKATGLDFHELKLEANFRMLAKDKCAMFAARCCGMQRISATTWVVMPRSCVKTIGNILRCSRACLSSTTKHPRNPSG